MFTSDIFPGPDSEMPTLARSRSPSPPSSPPRMSSEDAKTLKMKSPEELLANPMADMLKNSPFLLPAQLMALNPQLYAAQFAQLQAAQLMLAKQTLENSQENGDSGLRKRGAEETEPEIKHKLPRSASPKTAGSPLDLSSSQSPPGEGLATNPMFNPMMQAGLLNLMASMRPGLGAAASPAVSRSPPSPGGRHPSPWQAQWQSKNSDTIMELSKQMREAKQGPGFQSLICITNKIGYLSPLIKSQQLPQITRSFSSFSTSRKPLFVEKSSAFGKFYVRLLLIF